MCRDDSTISYQEVDKPNRGISEALRFVRSVRLAFGEDSKEYVEFLYLMNEFKNKRYVVHSTRGGGKLWVSPKVDRI